MKMENYSIRGIYYGAGTTFDVTPVKETPIGRALELDGENDYLQFDFQTSRFFTRAIPSRVGLRRLVGRIRLFSVPLIRLMVVFGSRYKFWPMEQSGALTIPVSHSI